MKKQTAYKVVLTYILLTTVFIPFQNCSKSQFTAMKNSNALNTTNSSSLSDPSLVGDIPDDSTAPNIPTNSVPKVCRFNGAVVPEGQSRTAYQNSTVAFGQSCVSEERFCLSGELLGSYNFGTCSVNAPASCLFNNQTIPHGGQVIAYQNSSVVFGSSCLNESEKRICNNGVLSGSNNFNSCVVGAPAACLFNGQTVAHSQSVTAFQNSNAGFGSSCVSEQRTCINGSLGGSYNFPNCNVDAPASCSFNGTTIAHGENVKAFASSSVAFGGSCQSQVRSCANGVLSGSNQFASCAVDAPAACLFNQKTLAHGEVVTAFASSSVPFGGACNSQVRSCENGLLTGSHEFANCAVDAPASCLVDGKTVAHGEIINTFASARVPFGASCVAVPTSCDNGQLSSSNMFTSCEADKPAVCQFEGSQVLQGSAPVVRYKSSLVSFGSSCESEQRSCGTSGIISGSFTEKSCTACGAGQMAMNGKCVQMYVLSEFRNTAVNRVLNFNLGIKDRCVLRTFEGDNADFSACKLSMNASSLWTLTIEDEGKAQALTCSVTCSSKSTGVSINSNVGQLCNTIKGPGIRMTNGQCCSGSKAIDTWVRPPPPPPPPKTNSLFSVNYLNQPTGGFGMAGSSVTGINSYSFLPLHVKEDDRYCQ